MAESYNVKAGRADLAAAEKYRAAGRTKLAAQTYRSAAESYRKAAKEDWRNSDEWKEKANYCEEMAKAVLDPSYQPSVPQVSENKTSERKFAPSNADKKNDEPKTVKAGGKADYSEYKINIVQPNNSMMLKDIAGLEEAKKSIDRMVIGPLKNPEKYEQYGLEAGGSIVLYGPPGTGKTTFVKAVANELGFPMVNVKCSELINSLIGETEKNIAALFDEVRRFVREQNRPIILFIDEFENIAKSRDSGDVKSAQSVQELLTQLDGFDTNNKNITIIVATNYYDSIDSAIQSRFKKKILVPLPDQEARKFLFELECRKGGRKLFDYDYEAIDFSELADLSEGLSGRDIRNIMEEFLYMLVERDTNVAVLAESHMEILSRLIKERTHLRKA